MPLVAAAVCPHPPLIVPALAAGAAGELESLRRACDGVMDGLTAAGAEVVVVVGAGERTGWLPDGATGSFAPFGVSIEVSLPTHDSGLTMLRPGTARPAASIATDQADRAALPLSLMVAAWLLGRRATQRPADQRPADQRPAARQSPVVALSVAADADTADLGGQLAGRPERLGLMVMGDGTACRGRQAPGYDDPRAAPYDDAVAKALATADTAALRGLDPVLSAELMVAGRAPWQVLAHAAAGSAWRSELTYYDAPYGVAYFVAGWVRA